MSRRQCKQHFPIILIREPILRQRLIIMQQLKITPALMVTFLYLAAQYINSQHIILISSQKKCTETGADQTTRQR